jgi:hypothetical protein
VSREGFPQAEESFRRRDLAIEYDVAFPYLSIHGQLLPGMKVRLEFDSGATAAVAAVIDTGAEMSVFDGEIATSLGIDPTKGFARALRLSGVAGQTGLTVYLHPIALYIGTPLRFVRLSLQVGFADPGVPLAFNVLGRRGFMDHVRLGLRHGAIPPQIYLGFEP